MGKLTEEQIKECREESITDGTPVRYLVGGRNLDVVSGELQARGTNVIYHEVYWNMSKETAVKVAKWTNSKPIWSE